MGGIAIGMMYFFHLSGVTASGTFYIGRITYLQVFFGIALTWVSVSLFASFLKERTHIGRRGVEVRVTLGSLEVDLKGMVDTGNFLLDPSTGKPVSLISLEAIQKLIPDMGQIEQGCIEEGSGLKGKIHWIPYQAIGQADGVLVGIAPDRVIILDEKNGPWRTDFILAVYKGTFPRGWDGKKIDLLLHPAVMEGGILEGEELEY
jgi:stage II sporulation protein GA (sporulation sigma-E factor processing peptidase)